MRCRLATAPLIAPLALAALIGSPPTAAAADPGTAAGTSALAGSLEALTSTLERSLEPAPLEAVLTPPPASVEAGPPPVPSPGPEPAAAPAEAPAEMPDQPAESAEGPAAIGAPVEMVVIEAASEVERSARDVPNGDFREEGAPPTATGAAGTGEAAWTGTASPGGNAEGGARAGDRVALGTWTGSGPPLPAGLAYLLVGFAAATIVVTMRRELGLHWRGRWRI